MFELSGPWCVAFAGLAFIAVLAMCTWLASLVRRDVSLVDRVWPVLIAGGAAVYALLFPQIGLRGQVMLVLALVWGVRLCWYITLRNWGHGEDRRYQEIRARNQPNFAFKSLYLIFGLQMLLAWIVTAPLWVGLPSTAPFGMIDWAGMAIAVVGVMFETIGDAQMARFKGDPAHQGQVMDRGLWRYTRHPNYFGESATWWGLWLMAIGGAGWAGAWSVVSPLLMTVLLLKVSGVSLLEKDIGERRPAYRDYIARTPAFFPWFPKKEGSE